MGLKVVCFYRLQAHPFGSSHVWIHLNPDFQKLRPDLEKHGLKYIFSDDHITGHPNKYEGSGIIVYKDIDKTCDTIAEYSKKDAIRYKEIHDEFGEIKDGVVKAMFAPPAPPSYLFQGLENNPEGLQRLRDYQLSSRQFTLENFENEHVRAFILGWAMAPQTLPDQLGTAQGFYVMIPSIHYFGQSIPEGGSGMLTESMKRYIEAEGSTVMTGATVRKFITENGECKGIRLENGDEIFARHAVVSSLDPYQTYLTGFEDNALPAGFRIRFATSSLATLLSPVCTMPSTRHPYHRWRDQRHGHHCRQRDLTGSGCHRRR